MPHCDFLHLSFYLHSNAMSDYIPAKKAEAVVKTDKDLQRELEDASSKGNLIEVRDLITKGGDPHGRTFGLFSDETLLHVACRYGVQVTLSIIPVVSLCISTEASTLQ